MMKAMILAAGRGSRMGTLTDNTSKMLLTVRGKALIDYHVDKLIAMGVKDIVLNLWYCADKIKAHFKQKNLGDTRIHFSEEHSLLGSGGGVYNALPLLGDEPFILISGDMWTDYDFENLPKMINGQAHIILVKHEPFHTFGLDKNSVTDNENNNVDYAGFGIFHPEAFSAIGEGVYGVDKVLKPLIENGLVTGEIYTGEWSNLNTEKELSEL